MTEDRLPTGLWVEAQLRQLDQKAIFYYIAHKGAYYSGTVLLKINSLTDGCHILTQIRDEKGKPDWLAALKGEWVAEAEADAYIQRAISRDLDLWVIEVEDREKNVHKSHFLLT